MEDSGSLIPCKFIIPIDLQSTSKIVKQHSQEAAGEEKNEMINWGKILKYLLERKKCTYAVLCAYLLY